MPSFITRVLTIAVLISAVSSCGSNGTDTSKFIGTWKYTSGTMTVTCPGQAATTVTMSGNITVSKGATSDLVVVDGDCSLKFDVNNSTTADAQPSQTCTTVDSTGTEVDTYTSVVLSTSDGATAHVSLTLNAALSSGGQSMTCTATETADLQKL